MPKCKSLEISFLTLFSSDVGTTAVDEVLPFTMKLLQGGKGTELEIETLLAKREEEEEKGEDLPFEVLEVETSPTIRTEIRKQVFTWQEHKEEIDRNIEEHLKNRTIKDLGYVARALLRLGVTELLYVRKITPGLLIKEIEALAEIYGDSPMALMVKKFLTGVSGKESQIRKGKGGKDVRQKQRKRGQEQSGQNQSGQK